MSNLPVHPRIAARASETCVRRIEAYQTTAVGIIEREIAVLRRLSRASDLPFADTLIGEYQIALRQLKALDPHNPPSGDTMLSIARRLQNVCNRVNTSRFRPPPE